MLDEVSLVGSFDETISVKNVNFDTVFYNPNANILDTLNTFFKRCKQLGLTCDPAGRRGYNFRNRSKPVYIQIMRVVETRERYLNGNVLQVVIDTVLFPQVDPRIKNYWLWCKLCVCLSMSFLTFSFFLGATQLKIMMKRQQYTGLVRISFFHDYDYKKQNGTLLAHILVNLDSDRKPSAEHPLWIN